MKVRCYFKDPDTMDDDDVQEAKWLWRKIAAALDALVKSGSVSVPASNVNSFSCNEFISSRL